MTLSSLSSPRSPALPTQQPTLPAPSLASAGTLQPPQHLAAPRRTAQPGPSAPAPLRATLPAGAGTSVMPARPTGPAPAEDDRPLSLADARKVAGETDYAQRLALASMGYEVLFKHTLKTYAAAQVCRTEWLESGDETDHAAAQTLSIKASLLNGLYLMRRHHREWTLDTPEISQKTLRNVLPLFRNALILCQTESSAVRFPVEGLQDALAYLEKQAHQSLKYLESTPASATGHAAACGELLGFAQQLQHVLAHGPVSAPPEPGDEKPEAAGSSSRWQRSFKSVLAETAPARPAPAQGGPAIPQPSAPRHDAPALRREPRPPARGLETPPRRRRPTPAPKAKPHHPGSAERRADVPTQPPTRQASVTARDPLPAQAKARDLTLERPAEPAGPAATSADAEAAARLRQERLAGLRGALAPLREEARRLHDAARDCAAAPVESGLPWARQSLEFAAWQSAALADDACAQSLAVHAQACGLGPRDPAVQELRRLFDRASRVALESAMQAAESALLVFLQSWDAADSQAGSKRAGVHSRADLVALGGDLQRQWREAPLWPRMPVLGARMAVFDACEAIHDVKAGRQTAARDAAERMCQAAADAQHACEGAKGLPGARLRTFRASCKSQRDDLLHTVVRQEYEAAEAALARASQELQPLLERSVEISTMCHVLLASDPLPAARTGEPALQAAPPLKPAAMPEADRGLIETARALEAATRAQREQAFKLPADSPGQAMLEQQAVLKVLQQSEKAAETAAATVTSFHALRAALALEPPDKQPSIVRSHVKAMAARAEALNDLLLSQEDALEHIPDAQVRDLVLRSCVPLRHDLRQVQVVEFSLETLAKLLDVRVSANHVSLRVSQGRSNARVPELNGKAHAAIEKWMQDSMGSIQDLLQRQEDLFEADTWQAARTRLTETIGTLHRRIHCESALIRAKYFLHVLDMVLPAPDSASLGLLKVVESLATQSIQRSSDLAEVTKAMQAHAAATPQPSEQHAQIRMNEAIRVQLRTKQKQLLSRQVVLLARKQAQATAAVSQGQAGQLQDGASSSASGRGGRRGRP